MSTKPRGTTGAVPELTRLKLLWRDSLSGESQDYWRSLFASTSTQAQIREQLKSQLEIKLTRDAQLTEFRQWVDEQDAMELEAQRQADEEVQLQNAHPDWDAERLRTEVINGSLRRAMVSGDFKGLGMQAVKAAQNEKQISLDRDRFELMRKKSEAFDQVKAAVNSGGVTPETLTKIERELKLL
jgi:hypothetical protein